MEGTLPEAAEVLAIAATAITAGLLVVGVVKAIMIVIGALLTGLTYALPLIIVSMGLAAVSAPTGY